ncbi:hypothetical protein [Kitasatospora sp. McL0602]|uniref:hypothetical protein n=1 Tax=Kitasatospora sp. McL0602 TaxID=3439530 RepID=UPI003F8C4ABA
MDSAVVTSGSPSGSPGADGARVRDLVRDIVAELAPDETPLVDGLFRFDDATVVRRLGGKGARREPLGFGMGEIAVLVSPVLWLALDEAAKRIAGIGVELAEKGVKAALRKVLRRPVPPVTIPPLTREQLGEVQQLVLETAQRRGLSAERAQELADAVVAKLALAGPDAAPAVGE